MSLPSQSSAEYILEDAQLGRLLVRVHPRARRLTFRTRDDAIHVSVPPGTPLSEVRRAVEELRPRLLASRRQAGRPPIDLSYRLDAPHFHLRLAAGDHPRFLLRKETEETFVIVCPPDTDFASAPQQAWFRQAIEECLRRHAHAVLPPRLRQLSLRHNLPYQSVRITASRSRWGSCSARASINLSCFLLLLPDHLIDYVLLHELSHTREMNHGPRFWALLDSLTDGQAKALRQELKAKKTDF